MSFTDIGFQQLVNDRIDSLRASAERVHARRRTTSMRRRFAPRTVTSAVLPSLGVVRSRPPAAGSAEFSVWAGRLAAFVAEAGIGAAERPVGRVVPLARRHGASPGAVAVLADRSAPSVARERALGLVLVALSPAPRRPSAAGERTVA